jgi:hypothetical protein
MGRADIVTMLIMAGADVNYQDIQVTLLWLRHRLRQG